MAEARDRAEWERTSVLAALIIGPHSKRRVTPRDFNPYTAQDDKGKRQWVDKVRKQLPQSMTNEDIRKQFKLKEMPHAGRNGHKTRRRVR